MSLFSEFMDKTPEENQVEVSLGRVLVDKIDETEMFIIKAHLIIEYTINHFLQQASVDHFSAEKSGFSFSHKLKICSMFGLFSRKKNDDPEFDLLPFINDLNKLRNQIAHKLNYDKKLLEEVCTGPKPIFISPAKFNPENFLITSLKLKTSLVCGYILGRTKAVRKLRENPNSRSGGENARGNP